MCAVPGLGRTTFVSWNFLWRKSGLLTHKFYGLMVVRPMARRVRTYKPCRAP